MSSELLAAFNAKIRVKAFEQFSLLMFDAENGADLQRILLQKILLDNDDNNDGNDGVEGMEGNDEKMGEKSPQMAHKSAHKPEHKPGHLSAKNWCAYVTYVTNVFSDRKLQLQRLINKALELIDETSNRNNDAYVQLHLQSASLKSTDKDILKYIDTVMLKKSIGKQSASVYLMAAEAALRMDDIKLSLATIQKGIAELAQPMAQLKAKLSTYMMLAKANESSKPVSSSSAASTNIEAISTSETKGISSSSTSTSNRRSSRSTAQSSSRLTVLANAVDTNKSKDLAETLLADKGKEVTSTASISAHAIRVEETKSSSTRRSHRSGSTASSISTSDVDSASIAKSSVIEVSGKVEEVKPIEVDRKVKKEEATTKEIAPAPLEVPVAKTTRASSRTTTSTVRRGLLGLGGCRRVLASNDDEIEAKEEKPSNSGDDDVTIPNRNQNLIEAKPKEASEVVVDDEISFNPSAASAPLTVHSRDSCQTPATKPSRISKSSKSNLEPITPIAMVTSKQPFAANASSASSTNIQAKVKEADEKLDDSEDSEIEFNFATPGHKLRKQSKSSADNALAQAVTPAPVPKSMTIAASRGRTPRPTASKKILAFEDKENAQPSVVEVCADRSAPLQSSSVSSSSSSMVQASSKSTSESNSNITTAPKKRSLSAYVDDALLNFNPETFRQSKTKSSSSKSSNDPAPSTILFSSTNRQSSRVPQKQLIIGDENADAVVAPVVRKSGRGLALQERSDAKSSGIVITENTLSINGSDDGSTGTHTTSSSTTITNTNASGDMITVQEPRSQPVIATASTASVIIAKDPEENKKKMTGIRGKPSTSEYQPSKQLVLGGFDVSVVDMDDDINPRRKEKKRVSFAGGQQPLLSPGQPIPAAPSSSSDENIGGQATVQPEPKRTRGRDNSGESNSASTITGKRSESSISTTSNSTSSSGDKETQPQSRRKQQDNGDVVRAKGSSSSSACDSSSINAFTGQFATIVVNGVAYANLGLLGKGGSSSVYRVLSPRDSQLYAYKRIDIRSSSEDAETVFESYVNEISLLQRLQGGAHVIQLKESEVCRDEMYISMVMEAGEVDLAKVLQQKQKQQSQGDSNMQYSISNPFFARMVWQEMLEAVDYIHQHRIVHGDLKPANFVFVKGHLKLIDFGIAKAISNDTTNIYRDSQIGTVNYMSPEAIAPVEIPSSSNDDGSDHGQSGNGQHSARMKLGRASDIWSLGCILYQILYGRPPFAALNTIQKLHAIPNPNHHISYPEHSDSAAIESIQKCLVRNPLERAAIRGPQGLLEARYLTLQSVSQEKSTIQSPGPSMESMIEPVIDTVLQALVRRNIPQLEDKIPTSSQQSSTSAQLAETIQSLLLQSRWLSSIESSMKQAESVKESITSKPSTKRQSGRSALTNQWTIYADHEEGGNGDSNRLSLDSDVDTAHSDEATRQDLSSRQAGKRNAPSTSLASQQDDGSSSARKRRATNELSAMLQSRQPPVSTPASGRPVVPSTTGLRPRNLNTPVQKTGKGGAALKSLPSNLKDDIVKQQASLESMQTSARAQRWMKAKPESTDMRSVLEKRLGDMRKFFAIESSPTRTGDDDDNTWNANSYL